MLTGLLTAQFAYWPVANAYIVEMMPPEMYGTEYRFVRTTYFLLASTEPVIGQVGDAGTLNVAFLSLATIACRVRVTCWYLLEPD